MWPLPGLGTVATCLSTHIGDAGLARADNRMFPLQSTRWHRNEFALEVPKVFRQGPALTSNPFLDDPAVVASHLRAALAGGVGVK